MAHYYAKELFKLSNCWLSPNGKLIVSDDEFDSPAFHEDLACCIIRDLEKFASKNEVAKHISKYYGGCATELLEDLGYVRLHGFRVEAIEAKWIIADQKLTFQQKQKIKTWCRLNNRTWDDAVQVC